jgi:hypothetical protein
MVFSCDEEVEVPAAHVRLEVKPAVDPRRHSVLEEHGDTSLSLENGVLHPSVCRDRDVCPTLAEYGARGSFCFFVTPGWTVQSAEEAGT